MSARIVFWGYVVIILYTLSPVLSVLLSSAIANALGAPLDEGGPHPTHVLGIDIGGLLSVMFVMGWLVFVTVPTGLLALIVFTIAWPIAMVVSKAKRNADDQPVSPE